MSQTILFNFLRSLLLETDRSHYQRRGALPNWVCHVHLCPFHTRTTLSCFIAPITIACSISLLLRRLSTRYRWSGLARKLSELVSTQSSLELNWFTHAPRSLPFSRHLREMSRWHPRELEGFDARRISNR